MEIKKCLNSEVPTPFNGSGYFYLDQETGKLKLKKSTETISWDLVGVDKYKDVDAETARLCHILENDDTEGYEAKVLIEFKDSCISIPLLEDNNDTKKWDAIKTSDGQFYTNDKTLVHTFTDDCTDKYIICYYHDNSSYDIYIGKNNQFFPDNEEFIHEQQALSRIKRAIYFNFDFYNYFWSRFFGNAGFGSYSSITFLDCNFEHVTSLLMYTFAEDFCNHLYILNEQTNNTLNFINVQTFIDNPFRCSGVKIIHGTLATSIVENLFADATSLTECPQIEIVSESFSASNMFNFCLCLKLVPLLDLYGAINCENMFCGCENLRYLGGFKGLKVDLSLADSPLLVKASLLNVLNNLADVTELGTNPTLTLAADSYAKLTADEIAIGTNKGWTIAYA